MCGKPFSKIWNSVDCSQPLWFAANEQSIAKTRTNVKHQLNTKYKNKRWPQHIPLKLFSLRRATVTEVLQLIIEDIA